MTRRARIRIGVLAGVAVLSVAASFSLGREIADGAVAGSAWLRAAGPSGVLLFVGGEFLVTLVGIVPGALLGIAAGAVFGVVLGFLAGAAGIMAGAAVAFALSRSTLRPWIGRLLAGQGGRLALFDEAFAREGWRIVALLRVSPVMPFSITSYALGFSRIGWRAYLLGTAASLPPLLGYVVIGTLGGVAASAEEGADIAWGLLAVGGLATFALTVFLSRLIGRVLRALPASEPA